MSLFKKKNEEKGCCCGGSCDTKSVETANPTQTEGALIKILGSGCAKCNELESNTKEALKQLGRDTAVDHVTDFTQIASYGVMSTPALVVGGKVVAYGKVLKTSEIVKILEKIL